MRKVRRTLPIVLTALAILGILAAAGHAKKPTPPPEPQPTLVKVAGGIQIQAENNTADPTSARVKFVDPSLCITYPGITPPQQDPDTYNQGPEFVSNPDQDRTPPDTPSLWVVGAPGNSTLHYFYCAHKDHVDQPESVCSGEHADYYYCLMILGGRKQKTGEVVFPVGSNWMINSKIPDQDGNVTVAQGALTMPVTFKVVQ